MLKPLFRLPQKMNLRFVKYFRLCLAASIVAIAGTAVLLPAVGLNFGIDFKGGTLLQIKTPGPADVAKLRSTVTGLGLGEMQLQTFGAPDEILIRFPEQPGGGDAQKTAADKVLKALGPGVIEQRREQVGSTVSKELINSAIWAIVVTCLGIFLYVWFRFEWQFAIGAIVSMIHDVMFTLGIFSLFRIDFDLTIVAALLTILGYSINDTVVIYDRIRENLRRYKRMPLGELLDLSVNETMSRTIMTVATVLMALIALYLFGGEVIRGFVFAMLFGVIVGTYSSVFIAAPFLILIGIKRDWSGVEKGRAAVPAPAGTKRGGTPDRPLKALEPLEEAGAQAQPAIAMTATLGTPRADLKPVKAAAPQRQSAARRKGQVRAGGGRSKRR